MFLIVGYACQSAPATVEQTPLKQIRKQIVQERGATLQCFAERYRIAPHTDHAERSSSRAYLTWTARKWKRWHSVCEKRLARDRKRWRVNPVPHAKTIARYLLRKRGWQNQYWALNGIVMGESSWRVHALNPSSGACGIPQSLPCAKMASFGADYRTNPETQIRWMLAYLKGRYGSPVNGHHFRMANGWY